LKEVPHTNDHAKKKKNGGTITYLKGTVRKESLPTFADMSPKIMPVRAVQYKGGPSESTLVTFDGTHSTPKIAFSFVVLQRLPSHL